MYLAKWITWFLPLWEGRKEGRTASMYLVASEPPNPLWAVYEDLLIFYRILHYFDNSRYMLCRDFVIDVCLYIYLESSALGSSKMELGCLRRSMLMYVVALIVWVEATLALTCKW